MASTPQAHEAVTRDQLAQWGHDPANLLQILIGIQQRFSHIPAPAVATLGDALGLSPAHIEGVIGFYSFLHSTPQGRFQLLFSDNIVDRMLGSRALAARLAEQLGVEIGTPSERVGIGFTSCTGMGDQGPAALVNGLALTRLDEGRIDRIAQQISDATELSDWPAELFRVEDNVRRRDRLLDTPYEPGAALRAMSRAGVDGVLDELARSGLKGRGGAGFATHLKWRLCRDAPGAEHIVVCNADEGEPGTFKDRLLLQRHAGQLIEGMTLCAAVIGARRGLIYLRGEYRCLLDGLREALHRRREAGLLGGTILGQAGFDFDIRIHLGAGAYICGEESALIESLEGKRGIPRSRPPFPVSHGYLGHPTVVNNVETFVAAAMIAQQGADWFLASGTKDSPGTKLLSVSGDCPRPGIYEYPFGTPIERVLADCGAEDTQAVQVAGAAGICVPPREFGRSIAFEEIPTGGSFMIFNRGRNLLDAIHNFSGFFAHESCGFCTPCRVGTTLLHNRLGKVLERNATREDITTLRRLADLLRGTSHCGLGQSAPNALLSLLKKFPGTFIGHLRSTSFEPAFDLDAALEEARQLARRDDPGAHLEGGGV
ncbi:MAG: NADP oxidoreductase [gamma proteobacterium symbiont of Phacoides pectinatus]